VASTDVVLFHINRNGVDWLQRLQPQFSQALSPPPIADWLARTELFAKLSDLEREHLAGFVGVAHYAPGEAILRQGERDQTLYILYEGEAIVRALDSEGKERPRDYVYPGAEFGEHAAFLDEPHSLTVEAATPNNWLYTHHDDLERYLTRYPEARGKLVLKPVLRARQQLKRLKWMDPDERLLLRERRHWVALLRRLAAPGVLVLLGLLLLALVTEGEQGAFRVLDILGMVLAVAWLGWNLIDWLNDYFIMTTKRVAHRERLLFIRETRDEAPLDKVQNVNIDQQFWGNMFGFGALVIDTAAAYGVGRVRFDYLGNPAKVQQSIFEEMGRVRAGERHEVRRTIRDKLAAGMGAALQPRIPPVATAPLAVTTAPPQKGGLVRQLFHLPRWNPLWAERKTRDQVIWRKHWFRLLSRIWIQSLGILATLAVAGSLHLSGVLPLSGPLLGGLIVVLLLLGFWLWWGYANWGNDQYIVTNDRIIDIEKLPLGFRSQRTETTFDKIQNVSYKIPNPLATILDYGTVIIHTAGPEGKLTFEWVLHPRQVQAEIFRRLGAYNENRRREDLERRTADLPDWFASYTDLTHGRP
jgi:CRP-like cAMP-binding protein